MPRKPSCTCGTCPKCKQRIAARERYQRLSKEERRAIVERRDPEKERAKDRARYRRDREKRLAQAAAYHKTPQGQTIHNRAAREWAQRNADKRKAQVVVGNALRDGRLVKGPCEIGENCEGQVEAHHDDYAKPMSVRWLCTRHHNEADQRRQAWDNGLLFKMV